MLAMLDLPDLGVARHDVPVVHLAACTTSGPWRPVPIEIAVGGDIRSSRSAFGEAIIGSATTVLADGQAALLDMSGSIEVELADADYWLESRDDDALANGANLAVVGSELSSSASRRRSASGGSACRSCYAGVAGRSGRWRHMLPASPSCC